jgi:hypothetical protein
MNVNQMTGGQVMRSGPAVDDNSSFAGIQPLRHDLSVIPTAAFSDRVKDDLIARQDFGPTVTALVFALGQRFWRAAGRRNLKQR